GNGSHSASPDARGDATALSLLACGPPTVCNHGARGRADPCGRRGRARGDVVLVNTARAVRVTALVVGVLIAGAPRSQAQISPGPLASAHRELEGTLN